MEILKQKQIIESVMVLHEGERYKRILWNDGTIYWSPMDYDGDCCEAELESEYQKLLNKGGHEKSK